MPPPDWLFIYINGMSYIDWADKTENSKVLIDMLGDPADDAKARFDVANRLFLRLYQASNLLHKTGTRAVSRYGATTQQWAVLGALSRPAARERGMTVKQLMEFLMVSRQNLTAVLDRLERAGLTERSRMAGDGRLRHIRLTVAGAQTWAAMQGSIRSYYAEALADFPTEDAVHLFRLLDRLRGCLNRIARAADDGGHAGTPDHGGEGGR